MSCQHFCFIHFLIFFPYRQEGYTCNGGSLINETTYMTRLHVLYLPTVTRTITSFRANQPPLTSLGHLLGGKVLKVALSVPIVSSPDRLSLAWHQVHDRGIGPYFMCILCTA